MTRTVVNRLYARAVLEQETAALRARVAELEGPEACHRCADYAEEREALRARIAQLEAALKEARPFIEEARDSFGNEDAEPATAMLSRIDAALAQESGIAGDPAPPDLKQTRLVALKEAEARVRGMTTFPRKTLFAIADAIAALAQENGK